MRILTKTHAVTLVGFLRYEYKLWWKNKKHYNIVFVTFVQLTDDPYNLVWKSYRLIVFTLEMMIANENMFCVMKKIIFYGNKLQTCLVCQLDLPYHLHYNSEIAGSKPIILCASGSSDFRKTGKVRVQAKWTEVRRGKKNGRLFRLGAHKNIRCKKGNEAKG